MELAPTVAADRGKGARGPGVEAGPPPGEDQEPVDEGGALAHQEPRRGAAAVTLGEAASCRDDGLAIRLDGALRVETRVGQGLEEGEGRACP